MVEVPAPTSTPDQRRPEPPGPASMTRPPTTLRRERIWPFLLIPVALIGAAAVFFRAELIDVADSLMARGDRPNTSDRPDPRLPSLR